MFANLSKLPKFVYLSIYLSIYLLVDNTAWAATYTWNDGDHITTNTVVGAADAITLIPTGLPDWTFVLTVDAGRTLTFQGFIPALDLSPTRTNQFIGTDADSIIFQNNSTAGFVSVSGDTTFTNAKFDSNLVAGTGRGIISTDNSGHTILNLNSVRFLNNVGSGGTIYQRGGSLTITGSEFTNNGATPSSRVSGIATWQGGAIQIIGGYDVYNVSPFTASVTDTVFDSNKAGTGGAIWTNGSADESTFSMSRVQFRNNLAEDMGGAISNIAANMLIDQAEFTGNTADLGGAIYNDYLLSISNSTFSGNKALLWFGGAITNDSGDVSLRNTQFVSNEANKGGAISNGNMATPSWYAGIGFTRGIDVTFTANTAADGGAVYNWGAAGKGTDWNLVQFTDSDFIGNTATNNGAGIYNEAGNLTLVNTNFTNNAAANLGGAVYNDGGKIILSVDAGETSTFTGNTAGGSANSIYFTGASQMQVDTASGGVIEMLDPMSGGGVSINKTGTGTWKLGGSNNLSAVGSMLSVEKGTLYLYSAAEATTGAGSINLGAAGGDFTLKNGATLLVSGKGHTITAQDIALQSGSNVTFDLTGMTAADTALTLTGNVANSGLNVDVLNIPAPLGIYHLFDTASANFAALNNTYLTTLNGEANTSRTVLQFQTADVNRDLNLSVTKPNLTVTWTGTLNSTWNETAKNWSVVKPDGNVSQLFLSGDNVIFDNSADNFDVRVGTDYPVGTFTVNSGDYNFSGSRSITGTTANFNGGVTALGIDTAFTTYNINSGAELRPGRKTLGGNVNVNAGSFVYLKVGRGTSDILRSTGIINFAGNADGTATIVLDNDGTIDGSADVERTIVDGITAGNVKLNGTTLSGDQNTAGGVIEYADGNRKLQITAASGQTLLFEKATADGKTIKVSLQGDGTGGGAGCTCDLSDIEDDIDNLLTQMSSLLTRMNSTESNISGLQTTIGALQSAVNSLQTTVSGLQTTDTTLQTAINHLQTTIITINQNITNLSTTDGNLQSSLNTLQTELDNLANLINGGGTLRINPYPVGSTFNNQAVYDSIQNAEAGSFANNLMGLYHTLSTNAERKAMTDSMTSPLLGMASESHFMSVQRLNNTLFQRLHTTAMQNRWERLSASASLRGQAPAARDRQLWANGAGDFLKRKGDGNTGGYQNNAAGVTVGYETQVTSNFNAGVALGGVFENFRESGASFAAHGKSGNILAGLYGSYNGELCRWMLTGGYIDGTYDIDRNVAGYSLTSSHKAQTGFAGIEISKPFPSGTFGALSPFFGFEYAGFNENNFSEYLAGTAVNSVTGRDAKMFLQTVGLRWGNFYQGTAGVWTWADQLTIGWRHDYSDDGDLLTLHYAGGTPLIIRGLNRVQDRCLLSYNFRTEGILGWFLFGSYTGELAEDLTIHTVEGGAGVKF
ncbi:hypothetical protein FACS189419_08800 [Planctomycetales bacterium]|nr:hypothetical protein FACS189419_08800 [Planctomycetales bacterium]